MIFERVILERHITRSGVVLLRFECSSTIPGQCVSVNGKHFVIAHWEGGVATVITWPGSPIDSGAGSRIGVTGPIGQGYDTDGVNPVIITGGLGFAAGLSLVQSFLTTNRDFRMLAFTRNPSAVYEAMEHLGLRTNEQVSVWNTSVLGRPSTPLDPLGQLPGEETPLLFAGPRSLYEGLSSALDKFGMPNVRIRLNY